ncbi:hypothetical protein ACFLZ3_03435 [Candidatus Omnitrophota bacterium]
MVRKDPPAYLLIGQDAPAKDIKLNKIKEELIFSDTRDFNLDILHARKLTLKELQEKILYLPFGPKKRLLVIRGAQDLKDEVKDFIIKYLRGPDQGVVLVLDMLSYNPKDGFTKQLERLSQVYRFREPLRPDTFALSRQIESGRAQAALRMLRQLLDSGNRPERILGGLRYSWERNTANPQEKRRRISVLLNCDIDIKTGRLKPEFALEKLVVRLCCFA